MNASKDEILENICYTELVYGRINKKLGTNLSKKQIEKLTITILKETEDKFISKIGKNYYVTNLERGIKITINSHTFRVITVDNTLDSKR